MAAFTLLVAFDTPKRAAAEAKALTAFLARHAKEADKLDDPSEVTDAARAYAKRFSSRWNGSLVWGEETLSAQLPAVSTLASRFVVYHDHGWHENDLDRLFKAAGAKVENTDAPPNLLAKFTLSPKPAGAALEQLLRKFFGQRDEQRLDRWKVTLWPGLRLEGSSSETALTLDGKVGVFTLPLEPKHVPALERVLAKGTTKLELSWANASDVKAQKRAAKPPTAKARAAKPVADRKLSVRSAPAAATPPAVRAANGASAIPQAPLNATMVQPCDDNFEPRVLAVTSRGLVAHGLCGLHLLEPGRPPRGILLKGDSEGYEGAVMAHGEEVWVSGRAGILHTQAIGKPFRPLVTPAFKPSIYGDSLVALARDADGGVWAGGRDGLLFHAKPGGSFTAVKSAITANISHLVAVPAGYLVAARGHLYELTADGRVRCILREKGWITCVCVTAAGTILVGASDKMTGFVRRSTNGGATFTNGKVKAPARFNRLHVLACLPDGRVVAGGSEDHLFTSHDDGKTFQPIKPHPRAAGLKRTFTSAAVIGDACYLGGEFQDLIRIA